MYQLVLIALSLMFENIPSPFNHLTCSFNTTSYLIPSSHLAKLTKRGQTAYGTQES